MDTLYHQFSQSRTYCTDDNLCYILPASYKIIATETHDFNHVRNRESSFP